MPTGYTSNVGDGTITELKPFALQCARAFGALISMRDEPSDTAIPERLEPHTTYNDEAREAAWQRLQALTAMSPADVSTAYADAKAAHVASEKKYAAEKRATAGRYDAMIAKVEVWQGAPEGIKEFMLDQLRKSKDFDCRVYDHTFPETAKDWFAKEVAEANRNIQYHSKARAEEIERTAERNEWLAQLRASLA